VVDVRNKYDELADKIISRFSRHYAKSHCDNRAARSRQGNTSSVGL